MRVFMLGWEFPPFISGGLGTACQGLTRALNQQQVGITFVLPKAIGGEYTEHVRLLSPQAPDAAHGDRSPQSVAAEYEVPGDAGLEGVSFKAVPAGFASPYPGGGMVGASSEAGETTAAQLAGASPEATAGDETESTDQTERLLQATQRYADLCRDLAEGETFDVIHAHDWMSFPAGIAVAEKTGKPLVVHFHSTEYDRAGERMDPRIQDAEKRGLAAADRVIAVSHLTRSVLVKRYAADPMRIEVIHNGLDHQPAPGGARPADGAGYPDQGRRIRPQNGGEEKTVLFLGRITAQKGPSYFIEAAKKVLAEHKEARFLMAGEGDEMQQAVELAAREGIGDRVLFTGFLHGSEVERVYRMADVFVMPSVSEPFGLATLEAMSHEVPVIMSRQAGVSEVVENALKVDFWNTDELAEKIISVLNHPALSETMADEAGREVKKLTWDESARRCRDVYEKVFAEVA